MTRPVSLEDKYVLDRGRVYLTGIQALVRVAIDQRRLDEANGLKTAGFFSGYRGSPLGGVDQELLRNKARLDPMPIRFVPGVNEELGATAVWGTQKVGLHGEGSDYDGVFGIWYGKAPGVDRAGDALKQANASGTAKYGGALALCGDDLLAKSSIIAAQSEFALQHFEMPFLNPADLQEVIDYGLHGIAMSRFAGNWTGLICLADTMDASGVVDVGLDRLSVILPESDPRLDHDVNRPLLLGSRLDTERLIREVRLPAAQDYVRTNGLDGIRFGTERARTVFVATGKAYRDLLSALSLLGIDEERASDLGIAIYKVAMPWPLDTDTLRRSARGKERLVVVEHKRAFMEPQIKDALYGLPETERPQIFGKRRPSGAPFLHDLLELKPQDLVTAILGVIPGLEHDRAMAAISQRMVEQSAWAAGHAEGAQRSAYFCSGCPHSTSTKVPDGARALPGIGCHAMSEINGNTTDGQIAMGGEGIPWMGQAPFSRDRHVFVNMGDGTYYHSGILAIRQAVAADLPITYKILYNDAVAMTGGQAHDGPLSVADIVRQLQAERVARIVVLAEDPRRFAGDEALPAGISALHRDEFMPVQTDLAAYAGVSAIVFDQTCAAEKRRRRKKSAFPDPDRRLFINEKVCEGCGDCSVQSNCIAVEPLATPFGEKRVINQSSCNKDFSCVKGFCPSFAFVEGAALKKTDAADIDFAALAAELPGPPARALDGTHNVLVTGIGGFGVTTVGAVLAMAAHIDGINASTLDMTGLAQKNGPVTSHVRFAPAETAIEGPRIPVGTLDALIASDMLVACGVEPLSMLARDRTCAVVNTKVQPTAEFVLKRALSFDEQRMTRTLREGCASVGAFDAAHAAEKLFGDQIFMNMLLVGAAFQRGALPLTESAILKAIALNGAAVAMNSAAFRAGRVLAAAPQKLASAIGERPKVPEMSLEERIDFLERELTQYQNAAYAARFRAAVDRLDDADRRHGQGDRRLTRIAAESLYKAMAYKDEYEVARLYSSREYRRSLEETFKNPKAVRLMLAPPLFSRTDPATGRPKKRAFGPWIFPVLKALSGLKRLRGSALDPFGWTRERRQERALITMTLNDLERACKDVGRLPYGLLCELVRIPSTIRGFGPVKDQNRALGLKKRATVLAQLDRAATIPSGGLASAAAFQLAAE